MTERPAPRSAGSGEPVSREGLFITGGDVVERGWRQRADIFVLDGRIVEVAPPGTLGQAPADEAELQEFLAQTPPEERQFFHAATFDATGCVVAAGFVDLFARLGEPGNEEAEVMPLAGTAAVRGGFTAMLAQPDTNPPLDRLGQLAELRRLAQRACNHVIPAATITAGARRAASVAHGRAG